MPIKELTKHVILYTYDVDGFISMGVLSDGILMTNLSEVIDPDKVDNDTLRALLDHDLRLKIGLISKIKLMWILRNNKKVRKKHGYFKRISDSFRTFLQGLKYQIKHRK